MATPRRLSHRYESQAATQVWRGLRGGRAPRPRVARNSLGGADRDRRARPAAADQDLGSVRRCERAICSAIRSSTPTSSATPGQPATTSRTSARMASARPRLRPATRATARRSATVNPSRLPLIDSWWLSSQRLPGTPGPGHVVGRGQRPRTGAVHQEGDVLDVVVLVAGDDVEDHAPELLLDDGRAEAQPADQQQELLVAVGARLVVADVLQRPDRLHVQLAARPRVGRSGGS